MEDRKGIPAQDPPGTKYVIWYKDLSDRGFRPGKPSRPLPGAHANFQRAYSQAIQFSKLRCYPVGVLTVVPVGETPNGSVAYSAVFG